MAWETFTRELAVALEALNEDEFLVLIVKQKNYFVQFAAQGSFGMRAEAVSNLYLPDGRHLSPEQSAGHPGNLVYRAMNRAGETIRFPNLGIRQRLD